MYTLNKKLFISIALLLIIPGLTIVLFSLGLEKGSGIYIDKFLVIIWIFILIGSGIYIIKNIIDSIKKITVWVNKALTENLKAPVKVISKDEINYLAKAVKAIVDELDVKAHHLEEKALVLEKTSKELIETKKVLKNSGINMDFYNKKLAIEVEERTKELKGAYEHLKNIQSRLIKTEQLSALGQLSAGIAHEVGNPLAAMLGYIQVLLLDKVDEGTIKKYINRIRDQIERIYRIIQQLLDYSRASAGEYERCNMPEIIEKAFISLVVEPAYKDIKINKLFPDNLPEVMLDADRLHRVFLNILLNAAQAIPGGGSIDIKAEVTPDNSLEISFSDTGYGMSKKTLERIFEPFFTTRGGKEGIGLGLSVSLQVINSFGGDIRVESEEGKGSCFTVVLPIDKTG
jgi:two-component system NtrC family sensor kinase